mgnify:CR=1 FL=1
MESWRLLLHTEISFRSMSTGEDKQRCVVSGKKSRIRRLAFIKLFQTHKASVQKSILGIRTKEAVTKAIAPHAPRNTGA